MQPRFAGGGQRQLDSIRMQSVEFQTINIVSPKREADIMRTLKIILTSALVLFVIYTTQIITVAQNSPEDEASAAIKLLSSPIETERQTGKEKLLQLGSKAIPPVLSLLKECIVDKKPHYLPGKEAEGEALAKRAGEGAFERED